MIYACDEHDALSHLLMLLTLSEIINKRLPLQQLFVAAQNRKKLNRSNKIHLLKVFSRHQLSLG